MNIRSVRVLNMFAFIISFAFGLILIIRQTSKPMLSAFCRMHGILVGSLVSKLISTGKNFYITKWVLH